MNFNAIKTLFSGPNAADVKPQNIAATSAVQLHSDPDTVFVDVRGAAEIAQTGTIRGAIRAPLPEFAQHADASGEGSLPAATSGKTIVLVCASGMRSSAAAQQLVQLGYPEVANVTGGIGQWKAANGPMEAG